MAKTSQFVAASFGFWVAPTHLTDLRLAFGGLKCSRFRPVCPLPPISLGVFEFRSTQKLYQNIVTRQELKAKAPGPLRALTPKTRLWPKVQVRRSLPDGLETFWKDHVGGKSTVGTVFGRSTQEVR